MVEDWIYAARRKATFEGWQLGNRPATVSVPRDIFAALPGYAGPDNNSVGVIGGVWCFQGVPLVVDG